MIKGFHLGSLHKLHLHLGVGGQKNAKFTTLKVQTMGGTYVVKCLKMQT